MIPVVWLNLNEESPNRGYWDMGMLEAVFDGSLWDLGLEFEHFEQVEDHLSGAVVVIPGRQQPEGSAGKITEILSSLDWVVLVFAGDEERLFPVEEIKHPNMKLWVMTPQPGRDYGDARFIGEGWPPGIRSIVSEDRPREYDWSFLGQVTHRRREALVEALEGKPNGYLLKSPGFTQGIDQKEYWEIMSKTRVVPCPGGPVTPDTFRFFEALESGCIPIADMQTGAGPEPDYWKMLFGEKPFFPIINEWNEFDGFMSDILNDYQNRANLVFSSWQQYKRDLVYAMMEDIEAVSGMSLNPSSSRTTVLVPTSACAVHPEVDLLVETVNSVRARFPDSDIVIMFDGVRAEQNHHLGNYREYTRRVLRLCNYEWKNVVPVVHSEHHHQGVMTRKAMDMVKTDTILFVEHDTPLTGDWPVEQALKAVGNGDINVLRFHHEANVLEPHQYLMLDKETITHAGLPVRRTAQWSQRPHIANTKFYSWMLERYFGWKSRTMIEDVVYGVLYTTFVEEGEEGWEKFKVYLYHPEGDIKRSYHTDGRKGESKYTLKVDYDSEETPDWAPHPRWMDA